MTDGDGNALSGMQLVLTAIDGVEVSGGGCILEDGCLVSIHNGGSESNDVVSIDLAIELRILAPIGVGTFGTQIDASINRTTDEIG